MKRKIKKYLFHVNEVEQYRNLLESPDEECKKLGATLFLSSKTYKHYLKKKVDSCVVKQLIIRNYTFRIIKMIKDYSHLRYKK